MTTKLLKLPNAPVDYREDLSEILPKKDFAMLQELLTEFYYARAGAKNLTEKTVRKEILTLQRFLLFCGKPPWMLTEEDFNQWCHHLGKVMKYTVSTQRSYQGVVYYFYRFLTKQSNKRDVIEREFRVRVRQIVHDYNRVPHLLENENTRERQAFSHKEITHVFGALREEIAVAKRFGSKDYWPLQRDYAMFYFTYYAGLRADEAIGVNIGSFEADPEYPAHGRFATVLVHGKGFRGSGKQPRYVVLTNSFLVEILDWYVKKVRPQFLKKAEPGEQALFLSERGKRIKYATFLNRFHNLMRIGGLDNQDFVPHCFRHTSVTHKAMVISTEGNRRIHGHKFASTTQRYSKIPDEYVRREARNVMSNSLAAWREKKQDGTVTA